MLPIESLPDDEARHLRGLLFDLDDTLLDDSSLGEEAYGALFRLRETGLVLVAVTGRPSGFGEVMARQWPIHAIVVENGALAHARVGSRFERLDTVSPAVRSERRARLEAIGGEVSRAFPELVRTDDAHARVSDLTFDIGEYQSVSPAIVAQAMDRARHLGARAIRSSVHLHLTLDTHDKATGTLALLARHLGIPPDLALGAFGYIGDSDNDAPCFAAFRTTIAVANFSGRPTVLPRYVTQGMRSSGFVEAARVIVERRR
jgi:HAD superfamily hydrolase (TIGR01484 family)